MASILSEISRRLIKKFQPTLLIVCILLLGGCPLGGCTQNAANQATILNNKTAVSNTVAEETATSPPTNQEPNCSSPASNTLLPTPDEIPTDTFRIVNQFPHDPNAFTQGLQLVDNDFIEGTGLYGRSNLRRVTIATGEILQEVALDPTFFGEGITVFDDRIYQLSWRKQTAFVYDLDSFELLQTFNYATEGWGLTGNGRCLIMSDGSSTLTFRDPNTFAPLGQLTVTDQNGPVTQINELEYINGEIYANIWHQNRIARIDPDTGQILSWVLLGELVEIIQPTNGDDVLNGIAYNSENGHLYVTGKRWPTLFEIELVSP